MQRNTYGEKTSNQILKKVIYQNEIPESVFYEISKTQYYQYQMWDKKVKRLAHLHPRLLLPLIKEIFEKEYPNDVRIEFLSSEYVVKQLERDGNQKLHTILADMVIRVDNQDIYHFECQIRPDTRMIIRMYEYDSQIALQFGFPTVENEEELVVHFPKSVILYLTHTKSTPDCECIRIRYPNGVLGEYTVPVMKIQNYSLEMIQDKQLYFILPLTILRFNGKENESDINSLTEFIKKSIVILEEAVNCGQLSEMERRDIMGDILTNDDRVLYDDEFLRMIVNIVPREAMPLWEREREDSIQKLIELENEKGTSYEMCQKSVERVFKITTEEAKGKMFLYWHE